MIWTAATPGLDDWEISPGIIDSYYWATFFLPSRTNLYPFSLSAYLLIYYQVQIMITLFGILGNSCCAQMMPSLRCQFWPLLRFFSRDLPRPSPLTHSSAVSFAFLGRTLCRSWPYLSQSCCKAVLKNLEWGDQPIEWILVWYFRKLLLNYF